MTENKQNELQQMGEEREEHKNKLTEMLDNLDVNDRHYNRKYADMSNRLDDLYDKIDWLASPSALPDDCMAFGVFSGKCVGGTGPAV